MNKLFTKVAALTLGVAMAAGVGVAVGASQKASAAEAVPVGGTDVIDSSKVDLSNVGNTSWTDDSVENNTSGAVYSYHLMGSKGTSDGRIGGTNANGGIWATASGGVLSSVKVTTVASKTLALYGGTTAFTGVTDTSGRTNLGSHATSSDSGSYSYTWSGLSSQGLSYFLLKGTQSSTFIKSVEVVWEAPGSNPTIVVDKDSVTVSTGESASFVVTTSNLTADFSVTGADENYFTVSYTASKADGNHVVTVSGVAATTAPIVLTVSSTGATSKTVSVSVVPVVYYEKITSVTDLAASKQFYIATTDGAYVLGKYVTGNNCTAYANIPNADGKLIESNLPADAALFTLGGSTGAWTLTDQAGNGYYGVSGNNNLKADTTTSDTWTISLASGGVATITSAASTRSIKKNSNSEIFSTYASGQTDVAIYMISEDDPGKKDSSVTITNEKPINVNVGADDITLSVTTDPTNAELTFTSSNTNVATVSSAGVIHVISNGTSTIEAVFDGNDEYNASSDSITINVSKAEPAHITNKTISSIYADHEADYSVVYEVEGYVTSWYQQNTDATKYGNFYIADSKGDTDNDVLVYGASSEKSCVWNGVAGTYSFSNDQKFLENEGTKDITIGWWVKAEFVGYVHSNEFQFKGHIVEAASDKPVSDWDAEVKENFENALDGFVPPYLGAVGENEPNISDGFANYTVQADVLTQANAYLTENQWTDKGAGNWTKATTNGLIEAYVAKVAQGTYFGFQYTANITVTVVQDSHQDQTVMQPGEFTLPAHDDTYTPAGKEFKAWLVAEEEKAEGAKINVTTNTTITAVYVNKVQTEWTDAQKAALETALHGYLPPFFGELAEEITTTENSARFTVSGDVSDQFATKLGDGWELIGTNTYMKVEDNYYLTASIYVEGVRLPVGDYSYISFEYHEGSTWSAALLNQFATVLHGVVPSYDDSVSTLAYFANYKDFEMAATDQATAKAQLDTLCAGWTYYEDGGFYYTFSQDQLGYVRGYLYKESDTSYSATLVFVQTAYDEEQQDAFYDKLGVVPPFFTNFATYTFYETDGMFVTDQITYLSNLSDYQEEITGYGFTLMGQSAGQRYVKVAGEAMDGTVYAYGAKLQDGGLLVVEIFTFYNYYLSLNIYYSAQPVSIALSGEYDTEFEYGEQLDTAGMVVTATMSDGTEQDVTSSAQFSGFDSLVEGEQTVTVTVGSVSTTYTVTVKEKVLQSIAVTSEPTKVVYKVGEEFDPEGLEVSATYNGGDPVVLDLADVEISGFDSSTTGEKTVTVAFGGKTASFTVTVELAYDADAFAKDLLDMVAPICANYDGKKNNKAALKTVWDTMSQRYSTLSNEEKAKVIAAAAKADGTDLEKAMAFYNYACKKYGLTKFIEGRQVKALVTEHETGNSILPIVVIVASSVAAITAIGVVIALKRRKALLSK